MSLIVNWLDRLKSRQREAIKKEITRLQDKELTSKVNKEPLYKQVIIARKIFRLQKKIKGGINEWIVG